MPTTGNRPLPAALGSRIRAGSLPSGGQAAPMTQATVAANVYKPPYVHIHFATEVAFDHFLAVYYLPDSAQVSLSQVPDAGVSFDASLIYDIERLRRPNSKYAAKRNLNLLIVGNVHTRNYCHVPTLFRSNPVVTPMPIFP